MRQQVVHPHLADDGDGSFTYALPEIAGLSAQNPNGRHHVVLLKR